MEQQIPMIIETLYRYLVIEQPPDSWPEYLQGDPVRAHGLWAFYRGLRLGLQLSDACLEKL